MPIDFYTGAHPDQGPRPSAEEKARYDKLIDMLLEAASDKPPEPAKTDHNMLPGHREIIQLSDEDTDRFEAQLAKGPNPNAKRTMDRLRAQRAQPSEKPVKRDPLQPDGTGFGRGTDE